MTIAQAIKSAEKIEIVSGEGEMGIAEIYTGSRTERALKMRIKKEKCGGDRFCFAKIDGERMYLTDAGLQF